MSRTTTIVVPWYPRTWGWSTRETCNEAYAAEVWKPRSSGGKFSWRVDRRGDLIASGYATSAATAKRRGQLVLGAFAFRRRKAS